MKRCTGCGEEKPVSEFGKLTAAKDGLAYRCKACRGLYRKANAEHIYQYNKRWFEDNKESHAESRRQYYNNNKGRYRKSSERYRIAHPEKIVAHHCVANAMSSGSLVRPSNCSNCGAEVAVQAHHWSYEKEYHLDVEWLCKACHVKAHKKERGLHE
tara:strand:- start:45 stop:512 length:468 start_codon:yes stop_codon:yes gene_type:complete